MKLKLDPQAITCLTGVVDILKELTHDVTLQISDEGIQIQGMDSSHIAFIDFLLNNDTIEYDIDDSEDSVTYLGVHLPSLYKILKLGSNHTCVLTNDDPDLLHFEFESPTKSLKIDLTLLDLEHSDFSQQDWDYANTFTMTSSEFASVCKDVSTLGQEQLIIKTDPDNEDITFVANGSQNVTNFELKCKPKTLTLQGNASEACYSLKHMLLFAKASAFTKDVEISFSKEYPLRIRFEMGGESKMAFYLASRIVD
jgi:proliferating cell nuclear antigen